MKIRQLAAIARHNPRGDTLIEVVVAIAILSLLIAVATVNSIQVYRTAFVARERSVAYNLAQAQADALRAYERSLSWDNFAGTDSACNMPQICKIIKGGTTSFYGSNGPFAGPRSGAYDPANLKTIDDIRGLSSPPGTPGAPPIGAAFYMEQTSNCVLDVPSCWQINPNRGYDRLTDKGIEAASDNDATYFITIVPNRAYIPGITQDSRLTNRIVNDDVLRFDIKVIWRSRISGGTKGASGGSNQEASIVTVLSRDTTNTQTPGGGP